MTLKKLFILSIFSFVFYACNNNVPRISNDKENIVSLREPSNYDKKRKKLSFINNIFSEYSTNAYKVYSDYVGLFGNNPENIDLEKLGNFSIIDDSHIESLNRLDTAIGVPVLNDLNPLIRSYKINARAFAVTINSCKSYYTKKDYKKDKYNQANVLHRLTLDIYSKFITADSILRVSSIKVSQDLENAYLNSLKESGMEVEYLILIGNKNVNKLNKILSNITYEELKADSLTSLYSETKTLYRRLSELKQSNLKQFNPESIVYYSNFGQFHDRLNDLIQHKKGKKKFSKEERKKLKENQNAANSVKGSVQAVTYSYKNLLKSFKEIKPELAYTNPKTAETKVAIAKRIKIANAIK